jgi:hypothetical protein
MAKGAMRPNKEKRKPKADKNKQKKGAATPMPGGAAQPKPAIGSGNKT